MKKILSRILIVCMLMNACIFTHAAFAEDIVEVDCEAEATQESTIPEADDIAELEDTVEMVEPDAIDEILEAETDLIDEEITDQVETLAAVTEGNITYSYKDKVLTISGTGAMPATIDECYEPWDAYRYKATKVVIKDGVTSISNGAFCEFTKLKKVSLPSSLTHIGEYAFSSCYALTSISLPSSLLTMGVGAFADSSIKTVTIPRSLKEVPQDAFRNCPISKLTVKAGVEKIGDGAFYGCRLSELTLPASIRRVEGMAFADSKLKRVILGRGIQYIGSEAFESYYAVTVFAPAGSYALSRSTALGYWTLPYGSEAVTVLYANRSAAVYLGGQLQIVTADYDIVSCKSSKTSVATVDNAGNITPVAAGSATITVKLSNSKTRKLSLTVRDPLKAIAVELNRIGTVTLYLDSTMQLKATMEPAGATSSLSWKSSNTKIATVVDGVVYPVKEGTVTIKVTTSTKKTASVKVQVVDRYKATAVALDRTGTISMAMGEQINLKATMTPANSTSKLTWASSSTSVATVSASGVVTAKKKGTTTITVKTSSGKKASVKVTVTGAPKELSGFLGRGYSAMKSALSMKLYDYDFEYEMVTPDGYVEATVDATMTSKPVDRIYVTGGSYTLYGVKVGMTTAQALSAAQANGLPYYDSEYDSSLGYTTYFLYRTKSEKDNFADAMQLSVNSRGVVDDMIASWMYD